MPESPRSPRYLEAIRSALGDEMRRDDDVVALGIDIGAAGGVYGVTAGLFDEFGPDRVIDSPIAEAGVVGAAVGAAMAGLRPLAEIMYMDFISVCLDPIVNQAAKLRYMTGGGVRVPVVFRTQTGGGRSAGAQHSQCLEGLLAAVPGLHVYVPATARDAYDLLVAAIREDSPVCFVENRRLYHHADAFWEAEPLPPGQPRVVRPGSELTVVTWGRMVGEVLRAVAEIEGPGADAEVIDLRTLVPLDETVLIESVARTGRCLVVHEAVESFGPGGELVARIVDRALFDLDGPVERYGALATPLPYSPGLEAESLPGGTRLGARIAALATA
jgi:pyruvate/2-oxoglutarate/acetoin dehydrogenase E1 component